jgi:hypothetical protein
MLLRVLLRGVPVPQEDLQARVVKLRLELRLQAQEFQSVVCNTPT